MAFSGKSSPRTTEYGRVRSRKKGWKAVRDTVGDRPKPLCSEVQNALAFHSVMVSGMVSVNTALPWELVREREKGSRACS